MRISDWSSDVCSSDLQPFRLWARLRSRLALLPIDRAGARKGLIREHGEEGPPSKSGAVPATVSGERDAHPHPSQKGTDAATGPDAKSCEAWEGCASSYDLRSEEHTSELQSLMRISYAVFCLKKKNKAQSKNTETTRPNKSE